MLKKIVLFISKCEKHFNKIKIFDIPLYQTYKSHFGRSEMNRDMAEGYGYMIVRVTTARGAIPLEGAVVTVSEYKGRDDGNATIGVGERGNAIATYITNSSGLTERFALPAPPRALSMSPGNSKGYLTYNVKVDKEGYYQQNYINAPVFEGITSIQNADMIPLSDNGQTDRADPYGNIFFESENSNLEGSGGKDE